MAYFGTRRYNSYRKRAFNQTDNKRRAYAQQMEELQEAFDNMQDWSISSTLDSAYKSYKKFELRLSNHSADNQYHDLENGRLIVNIKASKLDFVQLIESGKVDEIAEKINKLDLTKYRFINVANGNLNCYIKGFKTKKEVY
ncbi:TPA: hypothetical protein VCH55_000838 [Streptococcus pyogenes]|nr:hypothetical protein [Streptococcus pyogenes]